MKTITIVYTCDCCGGTAPREHAKDWIDLSIGDAWRVDACSKRAALDSF
jgi:hypothetical protein